MSTSQSHGRWLRPWLFVPLISVAGWIRANTNYVDLACTNPTPPFLTWSTAATNIADALGLANDGSTVLVAAGHYRVQSQLMVTNALTLLSAADAARTLIDGGGVTRCVYLGALARIEGFTITNGYASGPGGGIYCLSQSVVRSCSLIANTATGYGGGIYAAQPGLLVENTILEGNRASDTGEAGDGGGINAYYTTMRNCLFVRNYARHGGGFFSYKACLAENCTIVSNTAWSLGGGIHCFDGGANHLIRNTIIVGNSAAASPNWYFNGAGAMEYVCTTPSSGTACLTDDPVFVGSGNYRLQDGSPCRDSGTNQAWMAGEVDLDGRARIRGGIVDRGAYEVPLTLYVATNGLNVAPYTNLATAATAIQTALTAAASGDQVLVADGVYTGSGNRNLSFGGKAVHLRSRYGQTNCIIDCQNAGRAFLIQSGEGRDSIVDGFTVRNGSAQPGGGFYIRNSSPVIRDCLIESCSGSTSGGGGLACDNASALILNCLIRGCRAVYRGGGFYSYGLATNVIVNCIIRANSVESAPGGGGLALYGPARVLNCTVTENYSQTDGAGVLSGSGANPVLANSIIWGNTGQRYGKQIYCLDGTVIRCLLSNGTQDIGGSAALIDCLYADPLFLNASQADYRIRATSPGIDAGTNAYVLADTLTDYLSRPRIVDGNGDSVASVDMGAYENPGAVVGAAHSPMPPDGAQDIYPATNLAWQAGSGASWQDVYLGTDSNAVLNATTASYEYKGRQSESVFAPSVAFTPNTTYFWRIDGIGEGGVATGTIWSFRTSEMRPVADFTAEPRDRKSVV